MLGSVVNARLAPLTYNGRDGKLGWHGMARECLETWTESELVDAIRAGSGDGFAELYRRHAPAARMAVSDYVDDPDQQLDVVQEVFTRALARLDALRDTSSFRPWVLQIARNAAIDELRRRRVARVESIEVADDPNFRSLDPGPDVEAEVRELAEAIGSGVAAVSARDAAVLSMTVQLGFGPAEIASALGISNGNAKVILHRARRRLRRALEQQNLLESQDRAKPPVADGAETSAAQSPTTRMSDSRTSAAK
jgi:RNA polymerase sigma-70 factor, ECF subfamily